MHSTKYYSPVFCAQRKIFMRIFMQSAFVKKVKLLKRYLRESNPGDLLPLRTARRSELSSSMNLPLKLQPNTIPRVTVSPFAYLRSRLLIP